MAARNDGRGAGRGAGAQRGNNHTGRGRGRNIRQPPTSSTSRDQERGHLRAISQETQQLLPRIVKETPQHSITTGFLITDPEPPRLDKQHCPGFKDVKIQVVEDDTLDAAISLSIAACGDEDNPTVRKSYDSKAEAERPPCVLNMASEKNPGGGWLSGARAQEETLCRRSTLSATLSRPFYPMPSRGAIYSPSVVVFRASGRKEDPHALYDLRRPDALPVVSVVSMPALRRPAVREVSVVTTSSTSDDDTTTTTTAAAAAARKEERYKNPADRELMKEKMRRVLRIAAWKDHRRIVLGALGCGAFANPREEAARCWREVFAEPEFGGGWWSRVVFAVVDETGMGMEGNGNVGVFSRTLEGLAAG